MNCYQIIGVPPDATPELIQIAYRKRVLERHPDRGGSHADMVLLVEAYSVLSNPEKRAAYDVVLFTQAQQEAKQQADTCERSRKERHATEDTGNADRETQHEQTWAERLIHKLKTRFKDLVRNRIVTCPICNQPLRLPSSVSPIVVNCPKCANRFELGPDPAELNRAIFQGKAQLRALLHMSYVPPTAFALGIVFNSLYSGTLSKAGDLFCCSWYIFGIITYLPIKMREGKLWPMYCYGALAVLLAVVLTVYNLDYYRAINDPNSPQQTRYHIIASLIGSVLYAYVGTSLLASSSVRSYLRYLAVVPKVKDIGGTTS